MPQAWHSFTKRGFPLTYSKQLKGQTTTHAPQPTHFSDSITAVAKEASKRILVEPIQVAQTGENI
jgi:hypothetical protein